MVNISIVTIPLHALSAIIWVGGMFFAYIVLRPAVNEMEGPEQLKLLNRIFEKFFGWVILAAALLPMTGYAEIFLVFDGFENTGPHITIMHITGWLMIGFFVYLFAGPYQRFKSHVAVEEWPMAAARLRIIRLTILINLVLGLITSAIGSSGRFWL
jgi:uncharacterized membrane protein